MNRTSNPSSPPEVGAILQKLSLRRDLTLDDLSRAAGAQVFENTEIVNVEKDGEDFQVTAADEWIFHAPTAWVSAGAWADRISAKVGELVKLKVKGPQMCVSEPVPYAIAPTIGLTSSYADLVVEVLRKLAPDIRKLMCGESNGGSLSMWSKVF